MILHGDVAGHLGGVGDDDVITVRPVAVVPRLMVQYSRMVVSAPISTQVSSP
jgi:hypothetical protein